MPMPESSPALDETTPIDPPRKEAPICDPSGKDAPPKEAPPAEAPAEPAEPPPDAESGKPKPVVRIQKLRLGVRVVWWSAVALTIGFGGVALWMGLGRRDPFALFYAVLSGCCAMAGYGALSVVRRPSPPS